jgi:hypothetical protein
MNHGYLATNYASLGVTGTEKERRQEQWGQYRQQKQRPSMDTNTPHEDPHTSSVHTHASRKRADSHSQPYTPYDQELERRRRFSSASYHRAGRATQPSSSPPEIRRISGNFNAPTHVEIERHNDTAKSARSRIKRLENTVKGWVRA